jgi:anthranilate synthase component 1
LSKSLLADTLTPVSAYLRLREGAKGSFLFESVEGGERLARYSFIGVDPIFTITGNGETTEVTENGVHEKSQNDFFDVLHRTISNYKQPEVSGLPRFNGGLVGFIGYDAVRQIESIPCSVINAENLPDSMLGLFTKVVAFDHIKHQVIIIVNTVIDDPNEAAARFSEAEMEIARIEQKLSAEHISPRRLSSDLDAMKSGLTREQFMAGVIKGKEYIKEGDIFQVVLSQRFSTAYEGDIFNAYRALRVVNPSPYLYFIELGEYRVIGSSPEVLVRVEDGKAEVYPIAGTRARGKTEAEDRTFEKELLADEKERAEHIMLVDLGRNDLGRVCEFGTVNVDNLMFIVRFSHVMHIASRVTGRVKPEFSCIDVLKATFPAGTVSGAPKIRAMEIIDEIEPTRRGIYAGGVGYFDFSGNMDMCIAIRTMFASKDHVYFQVGAGIVADSVSETEFEETLNKGRALLESLRMAKEIAR